MARKDLETLVVSLEAQLKQFEKSMSRAYPMADKAASQIEKRFKKAESQLASFGKGFASGFIAGLPALGASAFAAFARNVVSDLAEIKDNADRAGLSIQEFQKLTFVARQGGGGASDIVDIFQKLNKNLAEAKAKGNDLAKILEANNVPLTDANGQLRSNVALFENIVDLINNAKNEQEATLVSMAAFGKSAADALPFLKQSSAELRRTKELAAVIGPDLVNAAAAFDDRLTAGWDNFKTRGKAAIADMLREFSLLPGLFTGESQIEGGSLRISPRTDADKLKEAVQQADEIRAKLANTDKEFFPGLVRAQLESELKLIEDQIVALQQRNQMLSPGHLGTGKFFKPTVIPDLGGGKGKAAKAENLLDLIASVESGGGYNTTLADGKYLAGGERELTTKTLDEIDRIQTEILNNPANKTGASPAGRYQIVRKTLRGLRDELGLSGNELFTPELQDKLATALINRRGRNPNALRNEFEGLRSRPDDQILSLYDSMSKDRIGVRQDTVDVQVQAEKDRKQQVEKLHNEAEDAREKAMKERLDNAKDWAEEFKQVNEDAAQKSAEAWDNFGQTIGGVAEGFVQALLRGESAADALKEAVAQLASQAVSQLFGTLFQGGAGGGGLFGSIVQSIAPGAGAALGSLGNAGNAGAVPLTAPAAIMSAMQQNQQQVVRVEAYATPDLYLRTARQANALDAVRQTNTLSTARRNAPKTMNRFQQLGTT
jgi:hypothetical protein